MLKPKPYRFVVRLPAAMKDELFDAARVYRRSVNSEIVVRLQQSLQGAALLQDSPEPQPLNPQLEQMLNSRLTDEEAALLQAFRRLNEARQAALLKLLS